MEFNESNLLLLGGEFEISCRLENFVVMKENEDISEKFELFVNESVSILKPLPTCECGHYIFAGQIDRTQNQWYETLITVRKYRIVTISSFPNVVEKEIFEFDVCVIDHFGNVFTVNGLKFFSNLNITSSISQKSECVFRVRCCVNEFSENGSVKIFKQDDEIEPLICNFQIEAKPLLLKMQRVQFKSQIQIMGVYFRFFPKIEGFLLFRHEEPLAVYNEVGLYNLEGVWGNFVKNKTKSPEFIERFRKNPNISNYCLIDECKIWTYPTLIFSELQVKWISREFIMLNDRKVIYAFDKDRKIIGHYDFYGCKLKKSNQHINSLIQKNPIFGDAFIIDIMNRVLVTFTRIAATDLIPEMITNIKVTRIQYVVNIKNSTPPITYNRHDENFFLPQENLIMTITSKFNVVGERILREDNHISKYYDLSYIVDLLG